MIPNRLIASFLILCLTFTQAAQAYSLAWLPHQPIPSNTNQRQAVVSLNNKGDLGKTLNDLGQSQHVKALVTAMVTAGMLQGLNATAGIQKVNAQSTFPEQLQKNLLNNTASAVVNHAINGGELQQQLEQSIRSAFIDTGSAQGANGIGDLYQNGTLNDFTHQLAHAIAGCAAGAAKSNDCSSGALGAVVGEMSAELYGGARLNSSNLDIPALQTDTANFARMMSGIAVAITGGDANAINLAADAGGNAAQNNYLSHWQQAAYEKEMKACDSAACKLGTSLRWGLTSVNQDAALVTGMALGTGLEVKDAAAALVELPQTLAMLANNPELLKGLPEGYVQGLQTTYSDYQTALETAGVDGATAAGVDFTHLLTQLALLPATVATGGAAAGYTLDKMAVLLDKIGTSAKTTEVSAAAGVADAAARPNTIDSVGASAGSGANTAAATNIFSTSADEAVFWSGKTNGIGGVDVACNIANGCGGTTLEQLMQTRGITLPIWDANNPSVVTAWQNASSNFAAGASGDVNAVIGSTLRPGSVWETVELPALKANPNVTSITTIDPSTGVKAVIFKR